MNFLKYIHTYIYVHFLYQKAKKRQVNKYVLMYISVCYCRVPDEVAPQNVESPRRRSLVREFAQLPGDRKQSIQKSDTIWKALRRRSQQKVR